MNNFLKAFYLYFIELLLAIVMNNLSQKKKDSCMCPCLLARVQWCYLLDSIIEIDNGLNLCKDKRVFERYENRFQCTKHCVVMIVFLLSIQIFGSLLSLVFITISMRSDGTFI